MFGLSDNKQSGNNSSPPPAEPSVPSADSAAAPLDIGSLPADDTAALAPVTTIASEGVSPPPTSGVVTPTAPPMPETPIETPAPELSPPPAEPPAPPPEISAPSVNLENAYIATDPPSTKSSDDEAKPSAASLMDDGSHDDLMKIKQQALQSLSPLVDELEQTPEERFKTTMMLIQASDNADLVKEAYEAANQIKDEKARAQALLDVVNEINYFTQHHDTDAETSS